MFVLWHVCTVGVQFYYFACRCNIVPSLFVEKAFLPLLKCFDTMGKSDNHKCMGLYLNAQFYSSDTYVYPNASTTISLVLYLCINFQNWDMWILQFCSSFQTVLTILSVLNFYINFSISMSVSAKELGGGDQYVD